MARAKPVHAPEPKVDIKADTKVPYTDASAENTAVKSAPEADIKADIPGRAELADGTIRRDW